MKITGLAFHPPWSLLVDRLLLVLVVDVLDVVPQRALREELHVTAELGAVHVLVTHLGKLRVLKMLLIGKI